VGIEFASGTPGGVEGEGKLREGIPKRVFVFHETTTPEETQTHTDTHAAQGRGGLFGGCVSYQCSRRTHE